MAKTKGKGLKGYGMPEYTPTLCIDIEDSEETEGLKIGQEVTVLVKGKIERLTQSTEGGCIYLKDFETEVEHKGVFEELAEDD